MTRRAPLLQGTGSKYLDRNFQRMAMKILPGEFYCTEKDEVIVTVLGSCVAACLLDPVALIGGMNHFMLPMSKGGEDERVFYAARYGVGAMEFLINGLLRMGAQRHRLVAKTFGGARVMTGLSDVGQQNIHFVRHFLTQEGIPIWSEDLGGTHPHKVYFFPHSGQVLVKRIERTNNDTIFTRESHYYESVSKESVEGDVELFT